MPGTQTIPAAPPRPRRDRTDVGPYDPTPNPYSPNLSPSSQLGLQASQLVTIAPGVAPVSQNVPLQLVSGVGQSIQCVTMPLPPFVFKAKTRVMRADIAAFWMSWAVNQVSAHVAWEIKQASIVPGSPLDPNRVVAGVTAAMEGILSQIQQSWPKQLMEQKDKPKRKTRTGPARQSHLYPYTYPAGGPLKLPLRPKKVRD